jgi:deoxyadenosine/deoxycytidine kinase
VASGLGLPAFIAVAGNIGVGKTTLVSRLAAELGVPARPEVPEDNGYLAHFYEDPGRWAFHTQVGFLNLALRDYAVIAAQGGSGVVERTIEEHHEVFARQLRRDGALSGQEFEMLGEFHELAARQLVLRPGLVIYLHADLDELLARIDARGRESESRIEPDYLRALDQRYEEFARAWEASPLIRVDTVANDLRTGSGVEAVIERATSIVVTRPF